MSDARARLRGALWVWRRLRFRLWAAPTRPSRCWSSRSSSEETCSSAPTRSAFVASGALVRGDDYPAGWLIAGVPAKAVKALPKAPDAGGFEASSAR